MQKLLCLLALLALPSGGEALRVPPLTRRHAVVAGASLVPGIMLPQQAAHADAIEDIARRNAEAAKEAQEQKAKAAETKALLDSASGGVNAVLTGGVLLLLGAAGTFFLGIKGEADSKTVVNLEQSRFLSDREKKQYSNLSSFEKRKLGIKD
jgi:uncharacterized membrane protein